MKACTSYDLKPALKARGMRTRSSFYRSARRVMLQGAVLVCLLSAGAAAKDALAQKDESEGTVNQLRLALANVEASIVSCLNGNGLWVGGSLHICSVTDTRIDRATQDRATQSFSKP